MNLSWRAYATIIACSGLLLELPILLPSVGSGRKLNKRDIQKCLNIIFLVIINIFWCILLCLLYDIKKNKYT